MGMTQSKIIPHLDNASVEWDGADNHGTLTGADGTCYSLLTYTKRNAKHNHDLMLRIESEDKFVKTGYNIPLRSACKSLVEAAPPKDAAELCEIINRHPDGPRWSIA